MPVVDAPTTTPPAVIAPHPRLPSVVPGNVVNEVGEAQNETGQVGQDLLHGNR